MPSAHPAPTVHLTKHQALGNDFLVALDDVNGRALDLGPAQARAWCHRRSGVGADGLIHGARPAAGDVPSAGIDVVMHLYNSDGSRAEISGNGIRCLAQAVLRHRGGRAPVAVATDVGTRRIDWVDGPDDLATGRWSVAMGAWAPGPEVGAATEALLDTFAPGGRRLSVDIGNPHLVVEVADLGGVDVADVGPRLESAFPDGINVQFVRIDPAPGAHRIDLRVWERGAGVTEACGSGACAAAAAVRRWGMPSNRVEVAMPGGTVEVCVADDGTVVLVGGSTYVADVEVPLA